MAAEGKPEPSDRSSVSVSIDLAVCLVRCRVPALAARHPTLAYKLTSPLKKESARVILVLVKKKIW